MTTYLDLGQTDPRSAIGGRGVCAPRCAGQRQFLPHMMGFGVVIDDQPGESTDAGFRFEVHTP